MAGLERLTSLIYHEKQQQGSMLCAQHALNSLLQENYFTTVDLSQIATSLDALEAGYDDTNMGTVSTNMDDTGFFSVQVLENALNVWGLSLVRWRSEQMRPYQEHPHTQLAFILNLQQHWYTLRRFGHAEPSMDADPGNGHWFNLNSFLSAPEWVSKLYLDMVLQQAEAEGYSVFAVVQTDPIAPLALSRVDADEIASTLPEPIHSSSSSSSIPRLSTAQDPAGPSTPSVTAPAPTTTPGGIEGFEDEDMELQAALQASLMGSGGGGLTDDFVLPPSTARSFPSTSGVGRRAPTQQHSLPPLPAFPPLGFPPPTRSQSQHDGHDPVAASMARNRVIMERMRREQEMALQEQYEEEAARVAGGGAGGGTSAGPPARNTRARVGRGEEEEEEMVRRAIAESQLLAQRSTVITNPHAPLLVDLEDDDDGDADFVDAQMEVDSDEEGYRPPVGPHAPLAPGANPVPLPMPVSAPPSALAPMQPLSYPSHRVYDDDDAELQAALKASLENVPEGFTIPDIPPIPVAPAPIPASSSSSNPVPSPPKRRGTEDDEVASEAGTSTTSTEASHSQPEEQNVSVDEMRRRRLARFGG